MNKNNLHNIKKTGFKIPKGYLDTLEEKVLSELYLEKYLKDSRKQGFNVPEGYFNGLEDSVLNKVSKDETKVVSLFNRKNLLYVSGVAAALVLMFNIFINREESAEINSEMVELYLEEQNLNSYELAILLNDAEILDEDFIVIEEQINESDLESYLLDNVNIEDIIEQ